VITGNQIEGTVDILDVQYGNVWTNIDRSTFEKLGAVYGGKVHVKILHAGKKVYEGDVVYGKTFADVPEGSPVAYLNSLLNFSLGINTGDFSEKYKIASGPSWKIILSR
jgi:hypothetical protein